MQVSAGPGRKANARKLTEAAKPGCIHISASQKIIPAYESLAKPPTGILLVSMGALSTSALAFTPIVFRSR